MGKFKEIAIEIEEIVKRQPSIEDLPKIMARHRLEQERFHMGFYRDLLVHILRIMDHKVLNDNHDKSFGVGSKYLDPKTIKKNE